MWENSRKNVESKENHEMTGVYCRRLNKNLSELHRKLLGVVEFLFYFPFLSFIHFSLHETFWRSISQVDTMPRPASQNVDPAEGRCHHLKLFTVVENHGMLKVQK